MLTRVAQIVTAEHKDLQSSIYRAINWLWSQTKNELYWSKWTKITQKWASI